MMRTSQYRHMKTNIRNQVDAVILAGGKAELMYGVNKLLQKFGNQIQLLKLQRILKNRVNKLMISSHRDHGIYQSIIPNVQCFQDDIKGHKGALMGMKSAWAYTLKDYILFVPCDLANLPKSLLFKLYRRMQQYPKAQVCYAKINQESIFSLCLMHRSALPTLIAQIQQENFRLQDCFDKLYSVVYHMKAPGQLFSHIKTMSQWQQFTQIEALWQHS